MTNQPTPQAVRGTVDRVPCPHCGKANDLRPLKEYEQLLEKGSKLFCDHCDRSMEVTGIQNVTMVTVRRDPTGKIAPRDDQAAPARTISAAQAKRLLGR